MESSLEFIIKELQEKVEGLERLIKRDPFDTMPRLPAGIVDRNAVAELVYRDKIDRPGNAFCLWLATIEAARLGIKKLQVFEFGVAHGHGLINLCNICKIITDSTDVEFEIYGFDSDVGMPPLIDYRDHPEIWHQGEFLSVHDEIRAQLTPNAQLISGNIKDTLPEFMRTKVSSASPIGYVVIDVDLYSSSLSCFEIFNHPDPDCYLPTTITYMDDVHDLLTVNSWTGEKLAIKEFNYAHNMRKIEELRIRKNHPRAGWHSHVHGLHVLDHKARRGGFPNVVLDINITAL